MRPRPPPLLNQRKRSWTVPLLWLGAAGFIGLPMLRDATSESMQRFRYADRYSCECDHDDGCTFEDGAWVAGWSSAAAGGLDPNRAGRCRTRTSGGHGYWIAGRQTDAPMRDYRAPTVEHGLRGGFGGTGRVRAAGS